MITIDIEMPKNCSECPLHTTEEDVYSWYFYWCPLIQTAIRGKKYQTKRFRKCPLKEIKNDD